VDRESSFRLVADRLVVSKAVLFSGSPLYQTAGPDDGLATTVGFHQLVAFRVNSHRRFSTELSSGNSLCGDLRAMAARSKGNPKGCGELLQLRAQAERGARELKAHPAPSGTFVAATINVTPRAE
jgi:hypothetical protein